ncbi:hypothetical protein EZS27_020673 [termite gut metagenome]|uniref:GmrSD restriction endonucleases N-terminal domain-containing protein n=1 Tax=termite gut metagenome TaxID=433724 RepID=A0A5J4RA65_9ZZZZ
MKTDIKTFEYTPKRLTDVKDFFNIPIYQRLYAWEEEQIVQLLKDLYSSYQKNPLVDYYIGNWVIYQRSDTTRYDIIDGQQRMTTLWLMGFVLKNYYSKWKLFISEEKHKRVVS